MGPFKMKKRFLIIFYLVFSGCAHPPLQTSTARTKNLSFASAGIIFNLNISDFVKWENDQILTIRVKKETQEIWKESIDIELQNLNTLEKNSWVSYTVSAPNLTNNNLRTEYLDIRNHIAHDLLLIDVDRTIGKLNSAKPEEISFETERHIVMGLISIANQRVYTLNNLCDTEKIESISTQPDFFILYCAAFNQTFDLWQLDENGPKKILTGVKSSSGIAQLGNKKTVALVSAPNQDTSYLHICDLSGEEKLVSSETCPETIRTGQYSIVSNFDAFSEKFIVQKDATWGLLALNCLEQHQKPCDLIPLSKMIGPENLSPSSLQLVNNGSDILISSFPLAKTKNASISLFNINTGSWKYVWKADSIKNPDITKQLGDSTKILGVSASRPSEVLFVSTVQDIDSFSGKPILRDFLFSFSLKTNDWTLINDITSDIRPIPIFLKAR